MVRSRSLVGVGAYHREGALMSRKPIFDAIKTARDGASFTAAEVSRIDALLDSLSVPSESNTFPQSALTLIKQFEGCKLSAYPDPGTGGDPWTVGWGSTGPGIKKGVTWTQAQADARLVEDVSYFVNGVRGLLAGAPATENQLGAMVSLAYNIGLGNFGKSTLLKLHKAGDYAGAANEFPKWNKAAGRVMAGLTRRREAEAKVYRGAA